MPIASAARLTWLMQVIRTWLQRARLWFALQRVLVVGHMLDEWVAALCRKCVRHSLPHSGPLHMSCTRRQHGGGSYGGRPASSEDARRTRRAGCAYKSSTRVVPDRERGRPQSTTTTMEGLAQWTLMDPAEESPGITGGPIRLPRGRLMWQRAERGQQTSRRHHQPPPPHRPPRPSPFLASRLHL